jgi:succinate-semialdehyde dehydrogenase/glutarate-semialdehyde dehydrogenase
VSEYAVTNPATGERVAEYPTIGDAALADAVATADRAHREWSRATTTEERAALVRRVGELHTERREELAEIIVREMGKPVEQALGEVDFCASIYEYYATEATNLLADEPITLSDGDGSAFVRRSSVGVLLGIMPWNYPYYQVARFAGPNLVVGNTILLKHAPQCPASAAAIQRIFDDAGFPAGAYTNIYASNDQVADLIADPRVQGVSVTGSERAGAAVAEIAGRNLKKVVLELGGSDPFILLSTDDLDGVVESAVAARLENAGQACNAAKRFVVASDLYEPFVDKLTAALTAVEPSDPSSPGAAMGPLSSTTAADRLDDQLRRAVEGGATLVGGTRSGNFVSPGVLTGVTPSNDAYREELFGPVAIVFRVESEDEAVDVANDTPYGLGSYVFTTDPDQALRVADRIEAGMVFVNIVGADAAELPFGGVKRSGFGRELGRFATEEFVNRKMIRVGA